MCCKQPAKLAILIQLLLLLLFCGLDNVHCATVHENHIDLQSLLDFKNGITEDPSKALATWNTSTHFCRWNGVICTTTRPWRVSTLNLTVQRLAGKISPSLANLTNLSILDLSSNRFFGQLPIISNLQQLSTFNLSINTLEGTIPDELMNCSNIRRLDISGNLLHGTIPQNIGSLTNLEHLDLADNNLTGTIPVSIQNLTKVNLIRLRHNQLEGSIPDRIWQLPNLYVLLLGDNMLSGEIPSTLNFSHIEMLGLEMNMLGKVLPPNYGDAFHQLQKVSLFHNKFEGQIPPSLGNASGLSQIDLSNNNFIGQIPTSFGRLPKLSRLILETNKLEADGNQGWEFLHALTNCTSLTVLSVAQNNLQGTLPDSVANLSSNLQYLVLSENNISGIVPPSIGNFPNLMGLLLKKNSFSGEIGEWIGNLKNLQGLYLSDNNLIGEINPSIGNLTKLSQLYLGSNKFEGIIPPSIGHLSQLSELNLSYNKLQGSIPAEVGNLQSLVILDLSSNKLTGEIPLVSFRNINGLTVLNLSHNNLSGNIPIAMEDMLALSMLDLSYNDLQGEIPRNGVFKNSTAVSLEGNRGLCGGPMNLRMPPCPTVSQREERRSNLIRIMVPIFGFMSLALLVYFLFLLKKTRRRTHLPLTYIGENFPKVSYTDLAQATKNFSASELIGRGSCGSVYRGKLKKSKTDVAVKVFDLEMRGAERSFLLECEALRSIQHRNLLPIITACSTVDNEGSVFKALVYEFMPNGNLDRWLHKEGDGKFSKRLGITHRINIAVNIADALDYLHHDCGRPTIHCDLKPSNILLDDDMTALLGDFGIARFYADPSTATAGSNSSIGVKGTIGYIAPEYAGGARASTSGDVYSFGIVLLEMMTGKRPTDQMFKDGLDIVTFVSNNVPHEIHHVIDAHLIEECKDSAEGKTVSEHVIFQSVVSLLEVALSCTSPLPSGRMNMKQIASKMHEIKTSYLAGCNAKK